MRTLILALVVVLMPFVAAADIASKDYVDTHVSEIIEQKIETKVDTAPGTVQTLDGEYTVTGAFNVPTPPLPPME